MVNTYIEPLSVGPDYLVKESQHDAYGRQKAPGKGHESTYWNKNREIILLNDYTLECSNLT